MAQKKISQLPQDSSPTTTDSIPTYDAETTLTKRALVSDLITLFFNNIPTGSASPITRWAEVGFDHVASGGVWSADSVGVNRNASMTAMVIYINGRRISIAAVTARTFAASFDTYIDVLDNGDGTGTLVYTTAGNNAASPALAANSVRIGIIVTGATTIAAVGSINQGQENKVLPIASSLPYAVTDSLGNLICPRDPQRKLLGYRQFNSSNITSTSTSPQAIPQLIVPVIVPSGRKVVVKAFSPEGYTNSTTVGAKMSIWDGVVSVGTQLNDSIASGPGGNSATVFYVEATTTPATSSKTYSVGIHTISAATATFEAAATRPTFIKVELN